MKISRQQEPSGLVLTRFGGNHSYEDATNALTELVQMTEESGQVFEIVVHQDDFTIDLEDEQIINLREKVRSAFNSYKKGGLAFVSNKDLVFGFCRQLGLMMENENIAIAVFRTEELAREWIKEIQVIQNQGK
jgi:hypothetical protein